MIRKIIIMRQLIAIALFALTASVPITVTPVAAQSVAAQSVAAQSLAAERTVTFAVENMTCALCPITVKRAMQGV